MEFKKGIEAASVVIIIGQIVDVALGVPVGTGAAVLGALINIFLNRRKPKA